MRTLRDLKPILPGALLLLAVYATGLRAQPEDAPAPEPEAVSQLTLDDMRTFTDVFNQARRNYVDNVDDRFLLDSAIRGMLSELDPHSRYLTPEEFQDLNDTSRGRYSGVGISVLAEGGRIVIKAVITGSPADEAGMNPGDIITVIDGEAVKGRYLPEAIDALDGEPGTELALTVLTPEGEERELALTRDYIDIPTLSYEELGRGYGYFRISQFHRESDVHLEEALASIAAEGTRLRGLVIDLRDNPGGVMQSAIRIADGFLDEGLILTTRGRNDTTKMSFSAHPGDWLPGVPLVVLVDRGSASASEVVAGALQDHGRALVVGERSFGKGSVQSVLPLRNGGGIKLTTARYFTPSGRSIQAAGIVPDIEVDAWLDDEAGYDGRIRESDLEGHLGATALEGGRDTPHDVAIEFPVDEILSVLNEAGLIAAGPESEAPESDSD